MNTNIEKCIESNLAFDTVIETFNENETKDFAKEFAKLLKKTDIIVLNGELGSGKTVFMSGIAKYFDIESQISSPTFTIVNEYITKNNENIYHFDVYRLKDGIEFEDSIGTEYFSNGISIIEWGNIINDILPQSTIYIDISKDNENETKRIFRIWRK